MIDEYYGYPEDFIRAYPKAVSREFCRGMIDYFEWCNKNNRTFKRTEATKLFKDDESCTVQPLDYWDITFSNDNLGGYVQEFNNSFWNECWPSYISEVDILRQINSCTIFSYKIQKTIPSGGYHVWHFEQSERHSRRIAAYVLYLNDVPEGGETEFLYQQKRIPPSEGTLVIFPASYTHTHRGNPPLRGVKYIMTGWIEYG
jgi:hypothetical protein